MDKCLSRVQEIEEKFGVRKSRTTAKLDYIQSATGLVLALFMWVHMMMVSSILLGKDTMYMVSKFFEGYYVLGKPYSLIVSATAAFLFVVFIIHALVAIRKFPGNYNQYKIFRTHMKRMNHSDTNLWFYQVFTGFAMFFLGSLSCWSVSTSGP